MNGTVLETRCLSSLAKVFPDQELTDPVTDKGSALRNEAFSFQVAFRANHILKELKVRIESDLAEQISVRSVGLVPSELPIYGDHDDFILRAAPGLYPDPLYPVDEKEGLTALPVQWRAIWLTVDIHAQTPPGIHPIRIALEIADGERLAEELFELDIIPASLPKQRLIHTEWFHADCLAVYYGFEVFSEQHWEMIDRYVLSAARHGMNMLLTPLFTPPLDTAVGAERPTVQLVDVEKSGESYRFGYEKLTRWIELCLRRGIEYIEFSHLFTQWGAKHAPKIVATENGESKRIFGWETDASGEAYGNFLSQFLPSLVTYIQDHGLAGRCYFHVSDEPNIESLASYESASRIVNGLLPQFPVIDALSDYTFYEKGLVKRPIPSNDHLQAFLNNGVPELWTYYCCAQYKDVSNRFFCFPSARNRILGMQLYKYEIAGFLHWGYNFWFSQLSQKPVDPYRVTDALHAFPSGDAFLVYPGKEGPVESIRLEVFTEALQDLRALQLLESLIGKEKTIELLEERLAGPLTFTEYPQQAEWMLTKRDAVNRAISELHPRSN
ncbi:DUF4091 domain-containing protein [Paenibacillus prosopidis]|uniref:Uncharacterized protein DUF4091 n=1 Tax=Paenibacillus prosopidis TaxID=630520 RepID=A0A368W5I6_9BACL|nr:DUF4091 domain-containing protein [Paenibacillus prosopidis]RCW49013.1 uncharacterized protein DUF4091 [Paenibacillus prosopidis]